MSAEDVAQLVLRERHPGPAQHPPGFDPHVLASYRPSYRCLAWDLNRKGYQVGDDHLGDDRPEAVQAQYRDEMTWLHESRTLATTAGGRKDRSA